jgi:predicted RNA-binding Zn-ribbon protein involved in translation (DUF1610 family)
MSSIRGDAGSQQILTGTEFRSEPVQCSGCGWSGMAGQLRSPSAHNLQSQVSFSCPACSAVVAVHRGLSDEEVMLELVRVRTELAAELQDFVSQNVPQPDELSYKEVRERIKYLA